MQVSHVEVFPISSGCAWILILCWSGRKVATQLQTAALQGMRRKISLCCRWV